MAVVGRVSFGLTEYIYRSAERLCEGELCCVRHRRNVSVLCFLYKNYHTVDHPMNKYLNYFVSDRNASTSAVLGVLTLVIPRCSTDQFSRSFLPAVGRMRSLHIY